MPYMISSWSVTDGVSLLAFAAVRHALLPIMQQYLLPAGPTAAIRRTLLQRPIDETDRRAPYRYIDPATYYVSSVTNHTETIQLNRTVN